MSKNRSLNKWKNFAIVEGILLVTLAIFAIIKFHEMVSLFNALVDFSNTCIDTLKVLTPDQTIQSLENIPRW